MTEQQPVPADTDDTAGHAARGEAAAAERDETDDTAGHGFRRLTDDGSDDVEGHVARSGRDTLAVGGLRPTHPKTDDEDDVAGHLSGALGSKKRTDDA